MNPGASISRSGQAFLTFGFRPMFLAASVWAALAVILWVAVILTGRVPPSRFDALSWHIHAMLFGFVPAAIAGFMLTAVATWTGRSAVRGGPLAALALLWVAGRVACLWSADLPLVLAAVIDVSFCWVVCAVVAREIILARNWRNIGVPAPLAVLGAANALMYAEAAGAAVPAGLGWRLGLAATIVLISVIGGRIIPVFTQNWLAQRATPRSLPSRGRLDWVALIVLQGALFGWAVWPASRVVGALLIAAAALTAWRLLRWGGTATLAEPLLTVLHVAYGWIAVGAALLGACLFVPAIPLSAPIHALTVGTIGTMVLAVMTRVSLGHTGRPLHADSLTALIYVLVGLAAVLRITAPFAAPAYLPLILSAAGLWGASFLLFVVEYAPILLAPRLAQNATVAPSGTSFGRHTGAPR